MKRKGAFRLTQIADPLPGMLATTDPRILGTWARDCTLRVLPWFEAAFPNDPRPRQALETLQAWIDTGEFHMAVIRKASLDAHAAARDVGSDTPARSAARSAGQAVATAHVASHALGAAQYGLQAIDRASADPEAVLLEQAWQVEHLAQLRGAGQIP